VNYRSEAACVAAVNRFHDSRFHGVRLVCRLRRLSTASVSFPTVAESLSSSLASELPSGPSGVALSDVRYSPVIVGGPHAGGVTDDVDEEHQVSAAGTSDSKKVSVKYFIIKSLTVQDLEASVRNGTWATQSHNEDGLNRAYDEAENVYLLFSANKSGEYFGYARMASTISGEPANLGKTAETEDGTPQSIPTPATETAPKGRIIDDSARGTIFWEADGSDTEPDSLTKEGSDVSSGQHWGRQFKLEWVSTAKLSFFRTSGLRNPWNANREVKIARDGTELEPSVGRRLVAMFHRSPPSAAQGTIPPAGMPYR